MKLIITVLSFLFIHMTGIAQEEVSDAKMDQLQDELINAHKIIGLASGVTKDGLIKWKSASGYSNMQEKIPFALTTRTRIASLAKPMTAIAVMQLYEKGLIDLDEPIQTYIPDYPKAKKGIITVRHLLSHTSGISGYKNAREAESTANYDNLQEAVTVFHQRKLKFTPGTEFLYSTYGYVVLGLIIEHVSGLTFESYVKQNIWDKVEMNNTGVEKYDRVYSNKSELYHFEKKKTKKASKNNLSNRIPGGGFYSTLEDMLKFGNGVLQNIFIQASTLEEMVSVKSLKKEGNPYGYGWFLYAQKPVESAVIGHDGGQSGASTQILINRRNNTVVVVLANTSGKGKEVIMHCANILNLSKSE